MGDSIEERSFLVHSGFIVGKNKCVKATLRNHLNHGGCWFAGTYVLIVVAVFLWTAATTKPSNVGLDWIPFALLSMPWYWLDPRLLVPGLIVNAGLMYLLGTLFQVFRRPQSRSQPAGNREFRGRQDHHSSARR